MEHSGVYRERSPALAVPHTLSRSHCAKQFPHFMIARGTRASLRRHTDLPCCDLAPRRLREGVATYESQNKAGPGAGMKVACCRSSPKLSAHGTADQLSPTPSIAFTDSPARRPSRYEGERSRPFRAAAIVTVPWSVPAAKRRCPAWAIVLAAVARHPPFSTLSACSIILR